MVPGLGGDYGWLSLTYEGVDLEKLADDVERRSVISQIDNFGQTPLQLFRKKHPKRDRLGERLLLNPFLHSPDLPQAAHTTGAGESGTHGVHQITCSPIGHFFCCLASTAAPHTVFKDCATHPEQDPMPCNDLFWP